VRPASPDSRASRGRIKRLVAARHTVYAGIEADRALYRSLAFHHRAPRRADASARSGRDRPRRGMGGAPARHASESKRGKPKMAPAPRRPVSQMAAHRGDEAFPEPAVALPPMTLASTSPRTMRRQPVAGEHPCHLLPAMTSRGSAALRNVEASATTACATTRWSRSRAVHHSPASPAPQGRIS